MRDLGRLAHNIPRPWRDGGSGRAGYWSRIASSFEGATRTARNGYTSFHCSGLAVPRLSLRWLGGQTPGHQHSWGILGQLLPPVKRQPAENKDFNSLRITAEGCRNWRLFRTDAPVIEAHLRAFIP